MDATENLIEEMRRKRLHDPEVRKNGYCEKCDFRGYFKLGEGNLIKSCECAINKAIALRLDKMGVPRRWRGMAFDALLQSGDLEDIRPSPRALTGLKNVYVEHLDQINSGELFCLGPDRPPMRSIALVGGSRRVKSAWAAQILEEKGTHSGAFAWFDFSETRSMLSDFKRLDEAADFNWTMGKYNLVIIDGVHGGACAPGFPSAWDAAIAARYNSGLATILLCEDEHDIPSYAWRDMLEDPNTLVLPFGSANTPAMTVKKNKPVSSATPQIKAIATQDDAEAAILDYLGENPDKIIKMIYDSVPAPQDVVKAALDSLKSTGDVLSRKKAGNKGPMTVFYVRPEGVENTIVSDSAKLSLSALAQAAGLPRSTVQYHRTKGKADAEIVALGSEKS